MTLTRILLLFIVPALTGGTQITSYGTARDYLSVTSENYPGSYPGPDSWTWRWSVESGLWAVMFLDFHMTCASEDNYHRPDALVISDPQRNLTYSCGNQPPKNYPIMIENPWFSIHLQAESPPEQQATAQQETLATARRFKCQVLFANTRGELQSKIDDMRAKGRLDVSTTNNGGGPLQRDTIIIILLVVVVPLIVIPVIVVLVVLLLRRRQGNQGPHGGNTSLHLNIGSIRRDSSVSYTRHGNGPPAGARSRLNSDSSTLSQDFPGGTRARAMKRSESNSSWAMRAEMNTTYRGNTGSCSSEQGHLKLPNVYSPYPGELGPFLFNEPEKNHGAKTSLDKGRGGRKGSEKKKKKKNHTKMSLKVGKGYEKSHAKMGSGRPHKGYEDRSFLSEVCRLSTICEESCGGLTARMSAAFPVVPMLQVDGDGDGCGGMEEPRSLAIANAGYMLMTTNCMANYVNCGQS